MNDGLDMIFYDRETGKVINDEIAKILSERRSLDSILRNGTKVGIIARDKAVILNGVVQNVANDFQSQRGENVVHDRTAPSTPNDIDYFVRMVNALKNGSNGPEKPSYGSDPKERCYDDSLRRSFTNPKQITRRDRTNKRPVARTVVSLGLTAIISIAAFIGIKNVADNISYNIKENKASNSISTLVTGLESWEKPSIVARNTHRTDNMQGYWYDNYAIAQDIVTMVPDAAFDATLFTIYKDMGPNAENAYIDNFGRVITAVGRLASPDENPLAYARTSGCSSFEDFATKNGFVDEHGLPSREKYIEFGETAVEQYYEYLQACANGNYLDKGTTDFGGRQ